MFIHAILATSLAIASLAPMDEPKPAPDSKKVDPKPADGDAPVADGFPEATKPGKIEVKTYPAYRSAIARSGGLTEKGNGMLFFPLFNHIQRKNVAMTAPVISNYGSEKLIEAPGSRGEVSMEFVYKSTAIGATGKDGAFVSVIDHPAATFLCIGVQGKMDGPQKKESLERLKTWLDEHKDTWIEAGPPRELGYHGPMTPEAQRLWEFQIPIKAVSAPGPPAKP